MALRGNTVEEKIWNFLTDKGFNAFAAAGIMGNFHAESGLKTNNLQNGFEKKLGFTDEAYTEAVDNGSYTNFVRDGAGYGLAQWTYWSRKQGLLEAARAAAVSVSDLEMQLSFFWKEIQEYKAVFRILKNAVSVLEASNAILHDFENPQDQSAAVEQKRAGYGQAYYDKYAAADSGLTEQQIRQVHVDIARGWVGCREADGSHKPIIDLYNSMLPLPRGYKVKYTDAWCATFGSAVAIKAGNADIVPRECGCGQLIELAKQMGIWVEDDAYVPDMADYILYDWQDGANFATTDNTGWPDHVGIVECVSGQTITVIEGNISDAVGRRNLQVNGRYIRGYICPKYASKAKTSGTSAGGGGTGAAVSSAYKEGDIVQFNGKVHYTSANADSGSGCKPGPAKITQIYQPGKSRHPYHLIAVSGGGSTVHGWVDAADIGKAVPSGSAPTHTVKSGDTLSALAKRYGSTVDKIVSANKSKYPKMTKDYILVGWVLTIPQ